MGKNGMVNSIDNIRRDFAEAISHGMIVSELAVLVAGELGMDEQFCNEIAVAGFLHDCGKLKMSEELHYDRSKAMVVEKMKYVRMHPTFSKEIMEKAGFSEKLTEMVYHHHENYDGSGYRDNIAGESIPLGARIIRVCDVYTALISNRSYREAFTEKVAVELMIEESKHFDMKIFLAFMRVIHSEDYDRIRRILKKDIEIGVADYFDEYILKELCDERIED